MEWQLSSLTISKADKCFRCKRPLSVSFWEPRKSSKVAWAVADRAKPSYTCGIIKKGSHGDIVTSRTELFSLGSNGSIAENFLGVDIAEWNDDVEEEDELSNLVRLSKNWSTWTCPWFRALSHSSLTPRHLDRGSSPSSHFRKALSVEAFRAEWFTSERSILSTSSWGSAEGRSLSKSTRFLQTESMHNCVRLFGDLVAPSSSII